jgi:CBS-domain-containing membrane protein
MFSDNRVKLPGILWPAIGATVAIVLALWLAGDRTSPFLLFSLGGSTVFLFALTDTDSAQPRALFGGHLGAHWLVSSVIKFLVMGYGFPLQR